MNKPKLFSHQIVALNLLKDAVNSAELANAVISATGARTGGKTLALEIMERNFLKLNPKATIVRSGRDGIKVEKHVEGVEVKK